MNSAEILTLLSTVGYGAAIVDEDYCIKEINSRGKKLLRRKREELIGGNLTEIAPMICRDDKKLLYQRVTFGEYITRCEDVYADDLPKGVKVIAFRDATLDACHDMLVNVVEQISDSVALYDEEGRLWMLNDAAVRMENLVASEVLGQKVQDIYEMTDGSTLQIPQVLSSGQAIRDFHCTYSTKFGTNMNVVSSDYPLAQNGQLLGAVCIMQDYTTVDKLNHKVIDLQEKLRGVSTSAKRKLNKSVLGTRYQFRDIIHMNKEISEVIRQCKMVAKTDSAVMLYGETGTGKELFAQSIHNDSERADGPFLAINCAAIPENLLETMLFGTRKGAYTGAENRPGLFEQAEGGTLLLDEINSMPMVLQAKLLRVLQEGYLRPVGGTEDIPVDVRVISNINIAPIEAVKKGVLRQDLFYRLGVVNIHIPPLRQRKEDIPLLVKHFIVRNNKKMNRVVRNIDQECMEFFKQYSWPGNVRELENAIEHAMIVLPQDYSVITKKYLPIYILNEVAAKEPIMINKKKIAHKPISKDIMEVHALKQLLLKNKGNISASARELGISRQNLQYRIKKLGVDPRQYQ